MKGCTDCMAYSISVDGEETEILNKDTVVRKDNNLITSKYKAPLFENQLVSICLSRIKEQDKTYIATITSRELRELFNLNDSNTTLYTRLINVTKDIGGRSLVVQDKDNNNFVFINIITDAEYVDGVFSIRFNDKLKSYFSNLKGRYTTYALANILNFKCEYSFRIYEIIKKEEYRITKENPIVTSDYGLSEFKCIIGLVDMAGNKIKSQMDKDVVDWDSIVEMSPDQSYPVWGDFKRYVLDKAKKEIDSLCDVCFDYAPQRKGRGGKVVGLKLFIQKNDASKKKIIVENTRKKFEKLNEEYEQTSIFKPSPELLRYVGHNNLKKSFIMSLLNDSGGNNELVIKAIKAADEQEHVKNYCGWIRACVRRGGYDTNTEVMNGSAETAEKVHQVHKTLEKNKDEYSAIYWNTAKKNSSIKFTEFTEYLEENGLNLEMFEGLHNAAQCGDIFMDWIAHKEVKLM